MSLDQKILDKFKSKLDEFGEMQIKLDEYYLYLANEVDELIGQAPRKQDEIVRMTDKMEELLRRPPEVEEKMAIRRASR